MVEVSLTVGKLDASLALLLTKDHHLIEFPTILLPNGVRAGSIVKLKCEQDHDSEKEEDAKFHNIQDEIYQSFATHPPKAPVLQIKNTTQTSCVLEWDALDLGTSNLKNLILFKDGKKLGSIPQPMNNKTSKLSGLPVDKSFKFQLRLDTTAGIFWSNEVEVNTHKMTDLSGITVCLGDFSPNDPFTEEDIEDTLVKIGAKHPAQHQVKVDTTHFLCTRENKQNSEYVKANEMNIPIIRPEWIKACERERRIVGVRDFYIKDCVLPDLFAKNYWGDIHHGSKNNVSSEAHKTQSGATDDSTSTAPATVSPEATLHDNLQPTEASNSDLPPLPDKEEKEESSDTVRVAGQASTTEEDTEPLEKQETNSTKLEVEDTEISTAVPNSAQEINETLEHANEGGNSSKGGSDPNDIQVTDTASSEALKEGIDDAFDALSVNDDNMVEVETKVSDHPVEVDNSGSSEQPAEPRTNDETTEAEKLKKDEEKKENEEEKKEGEAENAIKEEKFEQKEEKQELKNEREHAKKEADEERENERDEKKDEEQVDDANEEANDDSSSKENSPAPTGNGGKKKKKKNKKK
ncbi:unnamed protein product [Candida parapsilosis]|uniref:Chitin biosynthesis protein CHS5 n=1 Tax=Candida parapsilosis (strain CDC 317 / ATCC MYA-4646) TaxID=578454 RepID=G8BDV8_CANPC|nr:uncharacterized protein CPAR2_210990 [Candida parapsilosis]CCE43455.1 hypothetical protein CPAR2_210990 [Candida parapsilosis]